MNTNQHPDVSEVHSCLVTYRIQYAQQIYIVQSSSIEKAIRGIADMLGVRYHCSNWQGPEPNEAGEMETQCRIKGKIGTGINFVIYCIEQHVHVFN